MTDKSRLFGVYCAIDLAEQAAALHLAQNIAPYIAGFKLGLEFFTANGPDGVRLFKEKFGKPIFLDLKLCDIDNTVFAAMKNIAGLGVEFTTIHASGGRKMIEAAKNGAIAGCVLGSAPPAILAVTVLTSIGQDDFAAINGQGSIADRVMKLADLALQHGADGLVSSGHEVKSLRAKYGMQPILVVPGLRPEAAQNTISGDDQKRVMTPAEAWRLGGNILVVGRPITQATNPALAAKAIALSIGVS